MITKLQITGKLHYHRKCNFQLSKRKLGYRTLLPLTAPIIVGHRCRTLRPWCQLMTPADRTIRPACQQASDTTTCDAVQLIKTNGYQRAMTKKLRHSWKADTVHFHFWVNTQNLTGENDGYS